MSRPPFSIPETTETREIISLAGVFTPFQILNHTVIFIGPTTVMDGQVTDYDLPSVSAIITYLMGLNKSFVKVKNSFKFKVDNQSTHIVRLLQKEVNSPTLDNAISSVVDIGQNTEMNYIVSIDALATKTLPARISFKKITPLVLPNLTTSPSFSFVTSEINDRTLTASETINKTLFFNSLYAKDLNLNFPKVADVFKLLKKPVPGQIFMFHVTNFMPNNIKLSKVLTDSGTTLANSQGDVKSFEIGPLSTMSIIIQISQIIDGGEIGYFSFQTGSEALSRFASRR